MSGISFSPKRRHFVPLNKTTDAHFDTHLVFVFQNLSLWKPYMALTKPPFMVEPPLSPDPVSPLGTPLQSAGRGQSPPSMPPPYVVKFSLA
mmetsp:Transcript_23269/g.46703  ORF Transcript_23269/g.46703 Transcript_23269/m.46703 type:complete len:91 (-) Transcript_23269:106-378(-)